MNTNANLNPEWQPDGVADRVATIISSDSPLIKQAQGIGLRTANRRGLLNSSIASGAATSAAIAAATPIASQEAQQIYGRNINAANLAAAERERITAAISAAGSDYTSGIGQTLQNPDIPAAARSAAQGSVRDVMNERISALQRLYGVNLQWGSPASAGTEPTPGAAIMGG